MAAGVHAAGACRSEVLAHREVGGLGVFKDRQRIQIDAKRDRRAGTAGIESGDDAGQAVAEPRDPCGIGAIAQRFGAGGGNLGGGRNFHAGFCTHDLGADRDLPAEFFQSGGDDGGRAELAKAEFGVAVKITTPTGQLGGEGGGDGRRRRHQQPLPPGVRARQDARRIDGGGGARRLTA